MGILTTRLQDYYNRNPDLQTMKTSDRRKREGLTSNTPPVESEKALPQSTSEKDIIIQMLGALENNGEVPIRLKRSFCDRLQKVKRPKDDKLNRIHQFGINLIKRGLDNYLFDPNMRLPTFNELNKAYDEKFYLDLAKTEEGREYINSVNKVFRSIIFENQEMDENDTSDANWNFINSVELIKIPEEELQNNQTNPGKNRVRNGLLAATGVGSVIILSLVGYNMVHNSNNNNSLEIVPGGSIETVIPEDSTSNTLSVNDVINKLPVSENTLNYDQIISNIDSLLSRLPETSNLEVVATGKKEIKTNPDKSVSIEVGLGENGTTEVKHLVKAVLFNFDDPTDFNNYGSSAVLLIPLTDLKTKQQNASEDFPIRVITNDPSNPLKGSSETPIDELDSKYLK